MYNNHLKPLYINKITYIVQEFKNDRTKDTLDEYARSVFKLEKYYDDRLTEEYFQEFLLNEEESSLELSLEAMKESKGIYDFFVYAQNYTDNRPLNSPFAAIIEKSKTKARKYIGLSNLNNIASIAGLKLVKEQLTTKGLLLMTEKMIFNPPPVSGLKLGNSSVCLELTSDHGYKVCCLSSKTTEADGYDQPNNFIEELKEYYRSLTNPFDDEETITIVQNSLSNYSVDFIPNLYLRSEHSDLDFQSGDVWITLQELNHRSLKGIKNIILITTNFRHKISACALQI